MKLGDFITSLRQQYSDDDDIFLAIRHRLERADLPLGAQMISNVFLCIGDDEDRARTSGEGWEVRELDEPPTMKRLS